MPDAISPIVSWPRVEISNNQVRSTTNRRTMPVM